MTLDIDTIRRAPKVMLHDHLDGGLRPRTIVELAEETGYDGLPTTDPGELAQVISRGANRNDLVLYLETFAHTVAVMQTPEALERVAAECAEDLADDGVVYAEIRFAPELHIENGLSLDEVVEAVLTGFGRGSAGRGLTVRVLCSAMRQQASSLEIAELALRHRDDGVCGFDIAGPEAGYPPARHLDAFSRVMREDFHITIHAGEAFGLPSIAEALHVCGAERLGHGVRHHRRHPHDRRRGGPPGPPAPRSSATPACRWRCARRPTCTSARRRRSPSTRSARSPSCASGSP